MAACFFASSGCGSRSTLAQGASEAACAGSSWIDLAVDQLPSHELTASCSDSPGAATGPVGYLVEDTGAPVTIVGCRDGSPERVMLAGTTDPPWSGGVVAASYVDPMGVSWESWQDQAIVTLTQLGPVGGFIEGTFSAGLGDGHTPSDGPFQSITGTFHVCHVPDQL